MSLFFDRATMKGTGDTREVAAVGQLETRQQRNLLPEDFPPNKKSGKGSKSADGRFDVLSYLYMVWLTVPELKTSRSTMTLIREAFPELRARSRAGRIWSGSVTYSPWPPIASTIRS